MDFLSMDLAMDLEEYELDNMSFLRHVPSRWLSLEKAASRVDINFEAATKYFLRSLPEKANDGDKNAKKAIKTKYCELVSKELKKEGVRAYLKFVVSVAQSFRPFLLALQADSPQIHRLHELCSKLLHSVRSSLLQDQHLPRVTQTFKMREVDIDHKYKSPVHMSPSTEVKYLKLESQARVRVEKDFRKFYIKLADHLRKNLAPLQSSLVNPGTHFS